MKKIFLLFSFIAVSCAARAAAMPALSAGAGYQAARGSERLTDVSTLGFSLSAAQPLGGDLSLTATGLGEAYGFSSHAGLAARGAGLSLEYRGPASGAGAAYLARSFDGGIAARDSYSLYYWIRMLDKAGIRFSYGKTTRMNNYDALRANIGDRYLSAAASYPLGSRVTLGCDFRKGDLDDGNTYQVQGLEARADLVKAPGTVYAALRMERQLYDKSSDKYYSPRDYSTYTATLGYKQDVKVRGLQGLHAAADLKATGDSNGQFAVKPEASLNADLTSSLSLNVSYTQTYAPYLSDSGTSLSLTWKA